MAATHTVAKITKISNHPSFRRATLKKPESHITRHDADPIKDRQLLEEIKQKILSTGRYGYRNWLIFVTGINSARRCGDILSLRIGDILDEKGDIVKSVTKREEKTGKVLTYYLPDPVREAIRCYISSIGVYTLDDPLFKGQKVSRVDRRGNTIEGGFMATSTYWKILNNVKKEMNLDIQLSTHSMRKTFGNHKYVALKDKPLPSGYDVVDVLQDAYGHSSKKTTLRYLGITEDVQMDLYNTEVL